ncbi:hypothetical protein EDB80DRAFT_734272 [Ilyonectria destructans]|nr:hypothetical protein EDB80DRAFT_734272 [Ilyonectria destructans]
MQMMFQTTLQTMLQETSSHLMDKQKQMLERLWDALMENQRKAAKGTSDQLEIIRQLQQEIRTVRAAAADDRKMAEETRSMQEQTAREMKQMREQLDEQLRQVREQAAEETKQLREQLDAMAKSI